MPCVYPYHGEAGSAQAAAHAAADSRTPRCRMRLLGGLAGLLIVAACAAPRHDFAGRSPATLNVPLPVDPPGVIVGVAVSGGGSRAAMFSASVLHQLSTLDVGSGGRSESVLEKVTYLSSVSGGSLASAYYAMKKPPASVRMLEAGRPSAEYAEFFSAQFLPAMAANWEGPLVETAIGDAIPRADAIADRWDDKLFGRATFTQLAQRELRGDAPWLVLNGTSWESGRRMLFTTLPAAAFDYDFVGTVAGYLQQRNFAADDALAMNQRLIPEAKRFAPITFEEVNADPAELRVALAVASSSSVPLLLGPVTYSTVDKSGARQLLHVGDGGMFDNQGIESLAQIMFPKLLSGNPAQRRHGLMIVIDGSHPFDGESNDYNRARGLLEMLAKSPARISDIMEQRSTAYQLLLWLSLRTAHESAGQIVPDADHLKIIYLRHTDAYPQLAKQPPAECAQWATIKPTESEMLRYLSRIPTRFRLVSACDEALLKASAAVVVAESKDRIVRALLTP